MPFQVGAAVVVLSLGRKRGTIVEVGRGGRYRVQAEGVTIACREEDLALPPEPPRRAKSKPRVAPGDSSAEPPAGLPVRIDLHGMSVDDAIARVMESLDRAARRGADRVEVVHGKGTGRVRDAVHRHLAAIPIVAAVRLDADNPGVTWVWLR
jgi:DNA mismatch repair protein MutS2